MDLRHVPEGRRLAALDGALQGFQGLGGDFGGGGGAPGKSDDDMYDKAVYIVTTTRNASISWVQRQLRIGYNRAARLIEQMEAAGLVSAMQSNGNREVIAPARQE